MQMRQPPNQQGGTRIKLRLPSLHPGQIAVLNEGKNARYHFLCAGRGWRKTSLLVTLALNAALTQGKQVLWCAPIIDQIREAWDAMQVACQVLVENKFAVFNKTESRLYFRNGGMITFRSLEIPDNARSGTPDLIIVDEAAMVQPVAYYEVLDPMMTKIPDAVMWLATTPRGKNWFYDEWMLAYEEMLTKGDRSRATAWQIPVFGASYKDGELTRVPHPYERPDFVWDDLVYAFRNRPIRSVRQELMAEFVEGSGAVFQNIDEAIRTGERFNEQYQSTYSYQIGVDYARKHDFTVITVIRSDMRQVYWERFNQISWEVIFERTKNVSQLFGGAPVNIERVGMAADMQISTLRRMGVPVIDRSMTNKSKTELIDNLALLIEKSPRRWLMDIPQQTKELKAFQYETSVPGNLKMSAPKGENSFDDCVISLALACAGWSWQEDLDFASMMPMFIDGFSSEVFKEYPREITMGGEAWQ